MSRSVLPNFLSLAIVSLIVGCKYDGSFLQMDSNSGVPFFGLQLAVDSGSRPPKSASAEKADDKSTYRLKMQDPEHSPRKSRLGEDPWQSRPELRNVGN